MDSSPPPNELPAGGSFPPARTHEVEVDIPGRAQPGRGSAGVDDTIVLADRRPMHDVSASLYDVQRSLVRARIALRALIGGPGSAARGDRDAIWHSASFTARVTRLQSDADRLLIVAARLIASIEGTPGLPSPEERRQAAIAEDDARRMIGELNALTRSDPPAGSSDPLQLPL